MWPFKSNPPRTTNPELWERRDEELIRELIKRGYARPYKKTERKRADKTVVNLEGWKEAIAGHETEIAKLEERVNELTAPVPQELDQRHMSEWPTLTRETGLIERVCIHGVGHPDPEYIAKLRETNPELADTLGVHGCDGCCAQKPAPVEEKQ